MSTDRIGSKRCTACGEVKTVSAFSRVKNSRAGSDKTYPAAYCRSCVAKKRKAWRQREGERYLKYARDRRRKSRIAVLRHYGEGSLACACCGEATYEFLALDHIAGNGAEHRRQHPMIGHQLAQWLKTHGFPDGFRVLCHNCNMARGLHKVCPHEMARRWADVTVRRPTSIDESVEIGKGSIIWRFATICAGVKIGEQCAIGSSVYIGRGTQIGDRTRIQDGSHVTDRMVIGHDVFLAPHVITTNDRHPKAMNPSYKVEPPTFENGCAVGAGAVILPGVRVGEGAVVGAGAVVTKDVLPYTTVVGNPARILVKREVSSAESV